MQRAAGLFLALTLVGNVHADCELLYAPPEIRAAALKFHHKVDERRQARPHSARRPSWLPAKNAEVADSRRS